MTIRKTTSILLFLVPSLLMTQCGPRNEDETAIASDFEGVNTITQNPNGTFTLTWPVAFSAESRYLIYRSPKSEPFDFSQPFFSTLETQYTTDVLLFQPPICFVVRVSTDNLVSDTNEKSLCTESSGVEGTGFYPLGDPAQNNGRLTLSWPSLSIPGVKFTIFERYKKRGGIEVDEPYQDPLTTTVTTLYDAGITDRGSIRCFQLNVDIPEEVGLNEADFNSDSELCTDPYYEQPFGFVGVDSVSYAYCDSAANIAANAPTLNPIATPDGSNLCVNYNREDWSTPPATGNHGILISWEHASTSSDIIGYEVFLGSGFDSQLACILPSTATADQKSTFDQCLVLEPSNESILGLGIFQGLSSEVTYHFGIKAFDSYGRSDSNIKTIPIKAKKLDAIY